jgi:hypothetical protein
MSPEEPRSAWLGLAWQREGLLRVDCAAQRLLSAIQPYVRVWPVFCADLFSADRQAQSWRAFWLGAPFEPLARASGVPRGTRSKRNRNRVQPKFS